MQMICRQSKRLFKVEIPVTKKAKLEPMSLTIQNLCFRLLCKLPAYKFELSILITF